MPTYEYECESCALRFERFQNMTDSPVKTCPHCGRRVRRLIGAGSGIILKGSGFHATDYRDVTQERGAGLGASCDRDRPCCGRETPCDRSRKNA